MLRGEEKQEGGWKGKGKWDSEGDKDTGRRIIGTDTYAIVLLLSLH